MHRRELLKSGAAALTVAATTPLFASQGANNRVRMAVIGMLLQYLLQVYAHL